jgi:hypothetical protein
MPHPRPHLEIYRHASFSGSLSQPLSVTEQDLVITHLNPQGREACQVHLGGLEKGSFFGGTPDIE